MLIGIDARLWSQTGVGRYIRNLIKHLSLIDKKNNYCLFVRAEDSGEIKSQVQNSRFKIIEADIPWHSIKEQLVFPKILNRESLDLMHFTYFSVPIFYKKPYILTVHDLTLNHFKSGKASTKNFLIYNAKRSAYLYVMKKASKNAMNIIAVSKSTKHELVDHLGISENRITVIYE